MPINSTNVLKKVRVSSDSSVIATVSDVSNFTIYIINSTESLSLGASVTEIETTIASLALSPSGSNLFYLQTGNQAVIAGQCELGFYFDGQECLACDGSCTICQSAADDCFECQNAKYLDQNNCKDCVVGCLECQDGNSCENCNTEGHFVPDSEKGCDCDERYFLNQGVC